MKYLIRIFVDGYETTVEHFKPQDLKSVHLCIADYIRQEKFSFPIEMTRYNQPIALKVPSDFNKFTHTRIHLNPYDFHKKLDIQFDYINDYDGVHHCGDILCDSNCGTLYCGCIDLCRGLCGDTYDSY
jgi:hypothetical protein